MCKAGACILELTENIPGPDGSQKEKTGIVVIDVLDALVPQKDTVTFSDPYVKIFIKSHVDGHVMLGKTKVVWDTDRPVFNTTVKREKVPISSTVFFEVLDKDMLGPDDYIASVYKPIKTVLKKEMNHKTMVLYFLNKYFLRVKISWIPDE